MFIKIWQPITLCIDRMNWRAGHLTTTEGTGGGHLPTKIARRDEHLNNFSDSRDMPGCLPGGKLAAGIDSHIIRSKNTPAPPPLSQLNTYLLQDTRYQISRGICIQFISINIRITK